MCDENCENAHKMRKKASRERQTDRQTENNIPFFTGDNYNVSPENLTENEGESRAIDSLRLEISYKVCLHFTTTQRDK